MESLLQKHIYVYRRSFKYYSKLETVLNVQKFLFIISSLSAFVLPPLATLSLGAGVIEVIDKFLDISLKKHEYKSALKFYKDLLISFNAGEIKEQDVFLKMKHFESHLQFLPMERYLKQMKLNGYQNMGEKTN